METDILEIRVKNSYGDSFERSLEEPTCDEVIQEFVMIAQQLGYPLGCIYVALCEQAEEVKSAVQCAYKHIQESDNENK